MLTVMSKFKFIHQLQEIKHLYQQGKSYVDIARLLNSENVENDAQNIRRLLRRELGNISGHPKRVLTDEIKKQINILLRDNIPLIQISKILNIKYPTLEGYLRQKGLKFTPNQGNIHYFREIDTYSKAYILGFIAADGAIVENKNSSTKTLTITIKYEDKAILEFIKAEIGCDYKLLEIKRPNNYNKSKMIHHIRLSMSNPILIKDILKYGITPRKSLTLSNILLNISNKFRDAFIIGYFDGDGSVSLPKGVYKKDIFYPSHCINIQIRGTKELLSGICDHLNINKSHVIQCDSIPQLSFANKKDVYRFYQCYEHLSFYYKRKHERFLQRINHPSFDIYKQGQTISSSIS